MKKVLTIFIVVYILTINFSFAQTMISNAGLRIDSVTARQIKKLYLGQIAFIDGIKIKLADCATVQEKFLKKFVGKSVKAYKKLWIKNIFKDGAKPPVLLKDDDEVIDYVKSTENAIGYVSEIPEGGDIKVLRISNND